MLQRHQPVREAAVPMNMRGRILPRRRSLPRAFADRYANRVANLIIGAVAATVAYLAPPDRAYTILWRLASPLFPVMEAVYRAVGKRSGQDCRTLTIRRALAVMTRCRPGFDLPLQVEGGEELARVLKEDAPVILCTAHFGLTLAAPRILADYGRRAVLIAVKNEYNGGWHWGLREPLQVLADGTDVLLRARAVLRSGQPLISYVDYEASETELPEVVTLISPNIFQLARLTGATVLFFGSRLELDGRITIKFHRPRLHRILSPDEAHLCASEFVDFASKHAGWKCAVQRRNPRDDRGDNVQSQ
jgi:hypothetical protein